MGKQESLQEYEFNDKEFRFQLDHCLLPKKAAHKKHELVIDDFNECDKEAFNRLIDIRNNFFDFVSSGKNLFICGNTVGNGKTTWAIKLLQTYLYKTKNRAYWDEEVSALFISVPKFIASVKDFNTRGSIKYVEYIKENAERVDLIVWDDFACETATSFDRIQLYAILDSRLLGEQSNIFTSNVADQNVLEDVIGAKLKSRSYDKSEIIELNGKGGR